MVVFCSIYQRPLSSKEEQLSVVDWRGTTVPREMSGSVLVSVSWVTAFTGRRGDVTWSLPCLPLHLFSLASENRRRSRSHVCSVNHSQVCLYEMVSGGSAGWFPLTFGQVMLVVLMIKDYLRLTLLTSPWISCFLWTCSFFSFSVEFLETKSFQDHSLDRVRENIFKFSWHDINNVYSNFTWQVSCLD